MSKFITIGKLRGLQQCATQPGMLTCLALDHRQNLRKANPSFINDIELSKFKLEVTKTLSPHSTAVLLDPEVSAAQAIAAGAIPNQVGLVVAVESTGYTGSTNARNSQILNGWSIEKAKRMGASMVKLLIYYHPESSTAHEIEDFVHQVVKECNRYDIALMLEPLSYSLQPGGSLSSAEKRSVVIKTARQLVIPGVDILKAEFPIDIKENSDAKDWSSSCSEVSSASSAPWIVLSAAQDFETYLQQVQIACQAGASGCAVGRAVWQEAVTMDKSSRSEFLQTTAKERLSRLNKLCSDLGKPVWDFYHSEAPFTWFKDY